MRRVWAFARPYRRRWSRLPRHDRRWRRCSTWSRRCSFGGSSTTPSPRRDRGAVTCCAVLMVARRPRRGRGCRWPSGGGRRAIGEGLIYDLRVALFDHVQRMPLAFFTRTQTGALVSRLNNDVIGAQRARHRDPRRGRVERRRAWPRRVVAMLALEWRLTLLALSLLPVFVLPAKRVGRRLQELTREQMDLNASMNTTMTERFGVAGRHAREALRPPRRGDRRVRRPGRPGARHRRPERRSTAGRSSSPWASWAPSGRPLIYWLGGQLVISGAITIGTLVALGAYVTRIYTPLTSLTNARVDLMTAFVSFDRVFEVLDTPQPDPGPARRGRPGRARRAGSSSTTCGSRTRPAARCRSPRSRRTPGRSRSTGGGAVRCSEGSTPPSSPGTLTALVGPSGAGKTHARRR